MSDVCDRVKGHVMENWLGTIIIPLSLQYISAATMVRKGSVRKRNKSVSYFCLHRWLRLEEAAWKLPRWKECKDL